MFNTNISLFNNFKKSEKNKIRIYDFLKFFVR
jgi:hypothetical protein